MFKTIDFNTKIENAFSTWESHLHKNPITNVVGLSRSLLALGTLVTLIFNNPHAIFTVQNFLAPKRQFLSQINLFYLFGFDHLYLAVIICIIILLAVISGFYPRITGILHWWVAYSFFNAAIIVDGGDQITQNVALMLIPITLIDSRTNHWQKARQPQSPFLNNLAYIILQIIKVQICLLYLNAAVAKLNVDEWMDGTAMYYWFLNNSFGAPSFLKNLIQPLILNRYIVLLLTWGSILLELILAAAFFSPYKRKLTILKTGIIFHLLILILLGLGSFFFAMSGCLVIYLREHPFTFPLLNKFQLTEYVSGKTKVSAENSPNPPVYVISS